MSSDVRLHAPATARNRDPILAVLQDRARQERLPAAVLHCSLEPCFLCAGAILHARLARVVFGARDPKFGAVRSLATLLEDPRLNHRCAVTEGVAAAPSAELLRAFFRSKRSRGGGGAPGS